MKLLVVYHELFSERGYPPLKDRVQPAFRHLRETGYLERPGVEVLAPGLAPLELMGRVHTPHHLADVESSGFWETAVLSAGGVVEASVKLVRGEADNAFCYVLSGGSGVEVGKQAIGQVVDILSGSGRQNLI